MLVGLTGNFGSGKSTILKIFKKLGAVAVNSDEIVHKLFKNPEIKEKIVSLLGDILNKKGEIDRRKTAELIFHNNEQKSSLESLLHPLVMDEIKQMSERYGHRIVVAEIPLLFEGGYHKDVDKVITVLNQKSLIYRRLEKMGFLEDDISRRLSFQIPDEDKKKISDFVIDNSDGIENTERQVKDIYERLSKE